MITVLIADDHPMVREGLQAVISGAQDLEVVGQSADGRAAVREAVRLNPDVLLLDLDLPELPGIEVAREVSARCSGTAIIILTMFSDDSTIATAMAAGATGYLLKGASGDEIIVAVRAAASGHAVFSPELSGRLRSWLAHPPRPDGAAPFPGLTDRELQVLDHLAAGLDNAEIGRRLHLSAKTIANYVSTILAKLGIATRGQAIVVAREAGLGRLDEPIRREAAAGRSRRPTSATGRGSRSGTPTL